MDYPILAGRSRCEVYHVSSRSACNSAAITLITWSSYLGMPGEIPDKIVIAINLFITAVMWKCDRKVTDSHGRIFKRKKGVNFINKKIRIQKCFFSVNK